MAIAVFMTGTEQDTAAEFLGDLREKANRGSVRAQRVLLRLGSDPDPAKVLEVKAEFEFRVPRVIRRSRGIGNRKPGNDDHR